MISVDDADEALDPTDYFTYWGPDSASCIDRFYVPQSWAAEVQWVSMVEPPVRAATFKVTNTYQTILADEKCSDVPDQVSPVQRVLAILLNELILADVGKAMTAET